MSVRRVLVVGYDRLGLALAHRARGIDGLVICTDRSADWRRIAKLIRRRRIKVQWLAQMAWAEWGRPKPADLGWPAVRTNQDLLAWAERGVTQVYLYRAGLIVNRSVIAAFADVLNVHCAKIPAYGGVGAIPRALRDRAFHQEATLHRVTHNIDDGEVVATEPYELDPYDAYRINEDRAYLAGANLMLRQLASGEHQPGVKAALAGTKTEC